MMENILFLARRLFLCVMLSALGMTLVKGSSQENTMRLCCACLMVITIFGALPQMKTGMDWSFPQKETMEQAAQRGLEEGWESQKELICTQAEEYLGLAGEQVIIGEGEGHGEEMDDAGIYPEGL